MTAHVDFDLDVERLAERGLSRVTDRKTSYSTDDYPGGLLLSYNRAESHIEPEIILIKSIQELKELNGMPDRLYTAGLQDNLHHIPPAVPTLGYEITEKTDINLCRAISAYLYGNSALVKSYEDKINSLRFPLRAAVFSAKNITVKSGQTLKLKGKDTQPFYLVADTIDVESGGTIECQGPGKISSTQLEYDSSATAATGATPGNFLSLGGDGGAGGDGGQPGQAAPGGKGTNGTGDKHNCTTASGKGGKGVTGTVGGTGQPGGPGGDASEVNVSVHSLSGNIVAGSVGGNGGKGGKGGTGGQGGNGGPGGLGHTSSDGHKKCSNGPQGDGGTGGQGGPGGNGGDAGNGNKVYINWISGSPNITTSTLKANGGDAGAGGDGGPGGPGSSQGAPGGSGTAGSGGSGGTPGSVIINGPTTNTVL